MGSKRLHRVAACRVTGLLSVPPLFSLLSKRLFLPVHFFLPKTFLGPSGASRVITESTSPYVVRGLHYSYAPYTHAV